MRYLELACSYDETIAVDGPIDQATEVGLRRLVASGRQLVLLSRRPLPHRLFVTTREVWVETDPPLALDLDGEVRGRTPVRITLLPQALRVLVPQGFADS